MSGVVPQSVFLNALCAVGLGILAAIVPLGHSEVIAWACLAAFYLYFLASVRRPVSIIPGIFSYIKIDTLFLSFVYLIFFLPYQEDLLQGWMLGGGHHFPLNYYAEFTNTSLLASLSGVAAFTAGIQQGRARRSMVTDKRAYAGFNVFAAAILMAATVIYLASGWQVRAEGAYTGDVVGDSSTAGGVYMISIVLSMLSCAVVVRDLVKGKRLGVWFAVNLALVLYWALRTLWYGDRNSFFLIALVGIAGVFTFKFSLRRSQLLVAMLAAIAIYTAVGAVRTHIDRNVSDMVATVDEQDFSVAEGFEDSTVVARATFGVVPAEADYLWGQSIALSLVDVIPYVRGFILQGREDGPSSVDSSKILNYYLLRNNAGWGVGSNVISDAYMNGGFIGVVVLLFVLGAIGGIIERKAMASPDSLRSISLYLMCLALYAELPRYTVTFFVRPLVWVALLFLMHRVLVDASRKTGLSKN